MASYSRPKSLKHPCQSAIPDAEEEQAIKRLREKTNIQDYRDHIYDRENESTYGSHLVHPGSYSLNTQSNANAQRTKHRQQNIVAQASHRGTAEEEAMPGTRPQNISHTDLFGLSTQSYDISNLNRSQDTIWLSSIAPNLGVGNASYGQNVARDMNIPFQPHMQIQELANNSIPSFPSRAHSSNANTTYGRMGGLLQELWTTLQADRGTPQYWRTRVAYLQLQHGVTTSSPYLRAGMSANEIQQVLTYLYHREYQSGYGPQGQRLPSLEASQGPPFSFMPQINKTGVSYPLNIEV
jgi:hypothetical protein